jgi:RHS repeat-associated protein
VLKLEKKFTSTKAVAYAGDEVVYENDNVGSEEFHAANAYINTPAGTEGEIDLTLVSYGVASFYLKDHLGTTRAVLANDGLIGKADMYFAYGAKKAILVGTKGNRKEFTGKEFDEDGASTSGNDGMGLYYFGKRYLDPEIGRWVSVDPEPQNWDMFNYCGAKPVGIIDPDGSYADGSLSMENYVQNSPLRNAPQEFAIAAMAIMAAPMIPAFASVYAGGLATSEGFLLGSIPLSRGLPFAIPVIRFGSMNPDKARSFTTNILGIASRAPQISQLSVRYLGAVLPKWGNTLTNLTVGRIPAGTPINIGIAASQGGKYIGGLPQINVNPALVQKIAEFQQIMNKWVATGK